MRLDRGSYIQQEEEEEERTCLKCAVVLLNFENCLPSWVCISCGRTEDDRSDEVWSCL